MSYWSEVRNDYIDTEFNAKNGDVLAVNAIDAWREGEDQGATIARVLLSKHGDVLVDYIDTIAFYDPIAQEAISESKVKLAELFKEMQTEQIIEPMVDIDLGFAKLQAVRGGDHAYNEIFILLEDKKSGVEQPLAVVGQKYHYDENAEIGNEVVQDKGISVKVWTDKESNDYTHDLSIDVYEEDLSLENGPQPKTSLSDRIQSAASRAAESRAISDLMPNTPEPEH